MEIKTLLLSIALVMLIAFPTLANDDIWGSKVTLKLVPFNLKDSRFYIKEIIDGRTEKDNIGYVNACGNQKKPITLSGDFQISLQALCDLTFVKDNVKTPIVIKINVLQVGESNGLHLYNKAMAKVAFYEEKDGKLGKLFETESYTEIKGWSIFEPNERNIREVLEECVKNFMASNWESVTPQWEDRVQVTSQSLEKDHQMIITMPDRHNVWLLQPITNAPYTGNALVRYEYDRNATGWVNFDSDSCQVYSVDYGSYKGMSYCSENTSGHMRRFGDSGFGFAISCGIPVGLEFHNGTRRIFYGLNFQENIIYLPIAKNGLAATFGCYQTKLYNTDQLVWDRGYKFSLGFQR
jgi:hypothetical protein